MAKAVFLDRDETLNPDSGYISDPAKFELYPWVPPALKRLQNAGFMLVLITNQSGIGRGLIEPAALEAIHEKMNRLLREQGVRAFDLIQVCPHPPVDQCDCRKPSPKLILEAARALDIDLKASYMIGDREIDFQAGQNAGVRKSFRLASGNEQDFKKAVEEILKSASS